VHTDMRRTNSTSRFSPLETSPTPRRIVSFYPTSAGSSALWTDDLPLGTDALTYPLSLGHQLGSVTGLHAFMIEARSPLIAAAFESSVSGKRLHLDSLDEGTVLPFVRFLYTGYYASYGDWEDVPTSVWLHCRMYYLGHLYDLADLKSQAYVNVLRQCEFGCSSPNKPIDLCPAIDFVYRHLSSHNAILDALVQYCVACCLSHKLHENAQFRNVAFNVRAFHQDLTKACRDRDYEDESAAIIIQLPYMHHAPATYASTENPPISGFQDIIHHYHSTDRFDETSPKKRQRATLDERRASPKKVLKVQESTGESENGLVLLQKPCESASVASEKQSIMESETNQAKLPENDAVSMMEQLLSTIAHRQRPQIVIPDPEATYETAKKVMASLTQEEVAIVRDNAFCSMSEQQLNQASARKQDSLWLYIYDKSEQEGIAAAGQRPILSVPSSQDPFLTALPTTGVMEEKHSQTLNYYLRKRDEHRPRQDSFDPYVFQKVREKVLNGETSTRATGNQQKLSGLPMRPAVEVPNLATTDVTVKLPMRPLYPSSTSVPGTRVTPKDDRLPIWKRRDVTGARSGLSQALETLRTQEKQPQRHETSEATASRKQVDCNIDQPKEKGKQRMVSQTESDPKDHRLRSVQADTIPPRYDQAMKRNIVGQSTQDEASRNFPRISMPNSGNSALQDYQMQLMLLEQQNKRRLLLARQEQDIMTHPCSSSANTSIDMESVPLPSLPEKSTETWQEQTLRTGLTPPAVYNRKSMAPWNPSGAVEAVVELDTVTCASTSEQTSLTNPALSDHNMQLKLPKEQNQKRMRMAQAERDAFLPPKTETITQTAASSEPPASRPSGDQRVPSFDFKEQLRLTEEQLRIPKEQYEKLEPSAPGLQRYELELKFLEEQNKKDHFMRRLEEEAEHEKSHPRTGFSSTEAEPSSASDSAHNSSVPQPSEARTLESHQAQSVPFEQSEMESRSKQCVVRVPANPVSITAMDSASGATSTENVDASTSNHSQGGFTFDMDFASPRGDSVQDFDFDAFLEQNINQNEFGSEVDPGSDSDAQSWVDVALEPTSKSMESSPADAAVTKSEYIQMQLELLEQQNKKRLRMMRQEQDATTHPQSDSEWELC